MMAIGDSSESNTRGTWDPSRTAVGVWHLDWKEAISKCSQGKGAPGRTLGVAWGAESLFLKIKEFCSFSQDSPSMLIVKKI